MVNLFIDVFVGKFTELSFDGKCQHLLALFPNFHALCLLASYVVYVCRTVRSSAALALGKLSALSTRVDPLVGDLLSSLQVRIVIL